MVSLLTMYVFINIFIIKGMKRPPEIMSRFKLSQPEPIIINSSVVVGKEITKSR